MPSSSQEGPLGKLRSLFQKSQSASASERQEPDTSLLEKKRTEPLPPGWVWIYRTIKKDDLDKVLREGIVATGEQPQRFADPHIAKAEAIFAEVGEEKSRFHRTRANSIYAFFTDPRKESQGLTVDPEKEVVVQVAFFVGGDVMVADGELLTLAVDKLRMGDEAGARQVAREYYDTALPFYQYRNLREENRPDFIDFQMPEVLLPNRISPEHVRLASD